ncbi:MAG: DUF4199 domain-containing protein [Alistipes sp.]|nr:DUF4199 domain-containing protein [Alistipes sp.]
MKQNLFLNSVMTRGAIFGFIMLCSHIFEQCAVVYGGTTTWYSVMCIEMLFSAVLFVWMLYRFAKSFSVEVMALQSDVKMFSYGAGWSYVTSISALAGVIVGLGRYILHNLVIGHKAYTEAMISSVKGILESNPETSAMMGTYKQLFAQMAAQPEPSIFATIFSSVWSYAVWGMIVALIIAGVVKKDANLFDTNNNE